MTRTWLSSGCGLFAQELVAGLVESGAQVTFVAPSAEDPRYEASRPGLSRIKPPRELRGDTHRLIRAASSLVRIAGSALAMIKARFSNRVFVVSIPEPLAFGLPMLALLRLTGGRILFVAHDPVPHAWMLPAAFRGLEMWMHEASYRLASAVVVLSEPSKQKLLGTFPNMRQPVEVIEHGVFMLDDWTALPGSGRLLLFGTLRRNKGILEAIKGILIAAERGCTATLTIAGAPHREDAEYWQECEALAKTAPDKIALRIGYVENDALEQLIAESDALLMPYQEFFSQSGVALLAASNARPIIATSEGGLATLIDEGMPVARIASPVTAESVAKGVEAFMAIPAEEWRSRAEAYRDFTLAKRSWQVIGRQYLALSESHQS